MKNSMSLFVCSSVHAYLRVEVPEAAAEDTTPKLVMDSIRPPYTILFRMSSFIGKSFINKTFIEEAEALEVSPSLLGGSSF